MAKKEITTSPDPSKGGELEAQKEQRAAALAAARAAKAEAKAKAEAEAQAKADAEVSHSSGDECELAEAGTFDVKIPEGGMLSAAMKEKIIRAFEDFPTVDTLYHDGEELYFHQVRAKMLVVKRIKK